MFYWTAHRAEEEATFTNSHSAVTVGNKVYSFEGARIHHGRLDFMDQMHVNVLDTVSLRWKELPSERGERPLEVPSARDYHTAVLIEHVVYVWGGLSSAYRTYCNVLHAFDADSHTWLKPRTSGIVPAGRQGHSACVLGKAMYIYGGCNPETGEIDEIHRLYTVTMAWSFINTRNTAPASTRHTATIIGTKMYVFGGGEKEGYCDRIKVFDTETHLWLSGPSTEPPEVRWSHCAFSHNGELYVLGGHTYNTVYNDLWKFNSANYSWKKVEPKGKDPGALCLMCCCVAGDRIVLFRGFRGRGALYVLDLNPSLKTLCKLAVIQYGLEQSEVTHDVRWELAAMTTGGNR